MALPSLFYISACLIIREAEVTKVRFSVYVVVRSLISAHFFCMIAFLHPVKTFTVVVVLLPTFPFCPSLAGSSSSQRALYHKKDGVSLVKQPLFGMSKTGQ